MNGVVQLCTRGAIAALITAGFVLSARPPAVAHEKPNSPESSPPGGRIELRDGDRVVLLGNTFIEREYNHGHLETALTARWPQRDITFRNLGWSGDNVWGEARARFGSVQDGFNHLVRDVTGAKPTVILLYYGSNAAFAGEQGLEKFLGGLDRLIKALEPTKARFVLMAPLRHEKLSAPLPDPAGYNKQRGLYAQALRKLADERGYGWLDLNALHQDQDDKSPPLTTNGMHLTPYGYWRAALALGDQVGGSGEPWFVTVDLKRSSAAANGAKVDRLSHQGNLVSFSVTDEQLPLPHPDVPDGAEIAVFRSRLLAIRGLRPGKYSLRIDRRRVAAADHQQWAKGVEIVDGPQFDRAERLRRAVLKKNELFFHRWRPQNETYLFLFRKHEQGNNAVEIPRFDPLIEAQEKEIAKLRVPVPHKYEIIKEAGR